MELAKQPVTPIGKKSFQTIPNSEDKNKKLTALNMLLSAQLSTSESLQFKAQNAYQFVCQQSDSDVADNVIKGVLFGLSKENTVKVDKFRVSINAQNHVEVCNLCDESVFDTGFTLDDIKHNFRENLAVWVRTSTAKPPKEVIDLHNQLENQETHKTGGIIQHSYKYAKIIENKTEFFKKLHNLDYDQALNKVVKHINILQDHRDKVAGMFGQNVGMTKSMETVTVILLMKKHNYGCTSQINAKDIQEFIDDLSNKCNNQMDDELAKKLVQISHKENNAFKLADGFNEYKKIFNSDIANKKSDNTITSNDSLPPLASFSPYSLDKVYQISDDQLQAVKSSEFRTHLDEGTQNTHRAAETILTLSNWNVQNTALILANPSPGEGKDGWGNVFYNRLINPLVTTMVAPFAAASGVIGAPLRAAVHTSRPIVSYMENLPNSSSSISTSSSESTTSVQGTILTRERPLRIRSHNLGFTPAILAIAADLTPAEVRAAKLVDYINNDPEQPEIICFQETFHEDATKILLEGIKGNYPYIIHSVLPTLDGLNSGAAFASKYPIKSVEFKRFVLMAGFQALSPRGTCKVEIAIPGVDAPINIYTAHTQALVGEDYSLARFTQINDTDNLMKKNRESGELLQVLLGDFNSSAITAWGEDNLGTNQAEKEVYELMQNKFHDLFLDDHEVDGTRKENTKPHYLESDNKKMGINVEEPKGSWSRGPFQDNKAIELEMKLNRWQHVRQQPVRPDLTPSKWGTPEWFEQQPADTARFDYIVFPKDSPKSEWQNKLEGTAEIRRVHLDKNSQSGASDHLPVDARIWLKSDSGSDNTTI